MSQPNLTTGLLAAAAILLIWSGFIVFARAGIVSGLTPFDIAGLRFIVAGVLILPFAIRWWPKNLPLRIQILLSVMGPGMLNSLLMFVGLSNASAAYAGVFANGAIPLFTMLITLVVLGDKPKLTQILGAFVIILGGTLVAWRGLAEGGPDIAFGIVLFLGASGLIASYIWMLKRYDVTPRQALAIVNVPNTVIYLPIWLLFLPSTVMEVPLEVVALQAAFQGIGPGFLAVMIFAVMANQLGATATAGVAASVPAVAALLAVPVLNEIPTPLEWFGIAIVTTGLAIMLRAR